MRQITTFPTRSDFEKAKACVDQLALPCEVVDPPPALARVGVPGLILEANLVGTFLDHTAGQFIFSGWVDYYPSAPPSRMDAPPVFAEDLAGACAMSVLAPCAADPTKIRLVAHFSGNLAPAFPYLNAEMPQVMYAHEAKILTYMEGYRMLSLYPQRVTIAKADGLLDGWQLLDNIRRMVNEVWMRRHTLTPSYVVRKKPPAVEIYKRLPGTNCGACGEITCMAFAVRLWCGELKPSLCRPIFEGSYRHLKAPFTEICAGLGVGDQPSETNPKNL